MSTTYKTRSGRQIKKPTRYEPQEICTDDFTDEEDLDGEEGEDIASESELSSDSDDEDADENGNLKGFVVSDEDESDEEA